MPHKITLTIREACEARGITTAYALQKALGCFPATAARLFKGEMRMISLDALEDLADALDCELSDLIRVEKIEAKPARKAKAKTEGEALRAKALKRWARSTAD